MLHAVSLTIALLALWLLLSGHFAEPLLLGLWLASVVLVVVIVDRMEVLDHETHPVHVPIRLPLYWAWLIKEIVLANIDVAKAIVGFKGAAAAPTVFKVRASPRGRIFWTSRWSTP